MEAAASARELVTRLAQVAAICAQRREYTRARDAHDASQGLLEKLERLEASIAAEGQHAAQRNYERAAEAKQETQAMVPDVDAKVVECRKAFADVLEMTDSTPPVPYGTPASGQTIQVASPPVPPIQPVVAAQAPPVAQPVASLEISTSGVTTGRWTSECHQCHADQCFDDDDTHSNAGCICCATFWCSPITTAQLAYRMSRDCFDWGCAVSPASLDCAWLDFCAIRDVLSPSCICPYSYSFDCDRYDRVPVLSSGAMAVTYIACLMAFHSIFTLVLLCRARARIRAKDQIPTDCCGDCCCDSKCCCGTSTDDCCCVFWCAPRSTCRCRHVSNGKYQPCSQTGDRVGDQKRACWLWR